jgi:hypothetical protein
MGKNVGTGTRLQICVTRFTCDDPFRFAAPKPQKATSFFGTTAETAPPCDTYVKQVSRYIFFTFQLLVFEILICYVAK